MQTALITGRRRTKHYESSRAAISTTFACLPNRYGDCVKYFYNTSGINGEFKSKACDEEYSSNLQLSF